MPFNPAVTDLRGQMALQAGSNIADILLSGSKALGAGIAKAGESLGEGIGGGIAGAAQGMAVEKRRRDISSGELESLVQMGVVPPDQASKLLQGSTGKLEGAVNMAKAQYSLLNEVAGENRAEGRQMRYLDAQTNAAANLSLFKGATGTKAYTPSDTERTRMEGAGYIWDDASGKWLTDRSKYRSNPLGDLLNTPPAGAPTAPQSSATPPAAQPPAGSPAPYREGQTATNSATGQKLVFQGGRWVPAQ